MHWDPFFKQEGSCGKEHPQEHIPDRKDYSQEKGKSQEGPDKKDCSGRRLSHPLPQGWVGNPPPPFHHIFQPKFLGNPYPPSQEEYEWRGSCNAVRGSCGNASEF